MIRKVKVSTVEIGPDNSVVLIAGPCVIEDEESCFEIALTLRDLCKRLDFPFIFKASYDKANRSSIRSFRGPGLKKGIEVLKFIKKDLGIPVTTDVHCKYEVEEVAEHVDLIQIPAFLSRQTDLLTQAADTGKPINIKKGQFMSPYEMINVIEKVQSRGNFDILLTERGTAFGYNNLVVDFRSFQILSSFGCPVVFDGTHSVQLPGASGDRSSGNNEFVPILVRAATAAGCCGIFLETHKEPEKALCDGPNMIKLDELEPLLRQIKDISLVVKNFNTNQKGLDYEHNRGCQTCIKD
jgi:2-dehydro-3-deoxyphosphooctonate aldolase (KDO 8-P synthase)